MSLVKGISVEQKHDHLDDEIADLKQELERFQQEKERVRAIIGKIGGVPKFHSKLINIIFIIVIAVSVVVSIVSGEKWRLLMIEFTTVALSVKILYMIHCQMRVNHFKFWILSSIEWQLIELRKQMKHAK